jgi:HD-GYP domain-containing protein (c-di-GMP phosphodiesterase class II)
MRIQSLLSRLRQQHVKSPAWGLAHTRENVLFGIILAIAVFGLFAYILSMIGSFYAGYIDTAVIDTLFYFWIIYLLFTQQVTFHKRALGLIIPFWLLSIYLLLRFGINGAGFLWLFAALTLAGMFLSLKEGLITLFVTVVALALIGLALYLGLLDSIFGEPTLLSWMIMAGNTIALSILIMVSAAVMIRGLNRVLIQLDRKIKELSFTEDVTIETVATLAEYRDANTGEHIERTKAYVRAIAECLSQLDKYKELLTQESIELLYKAAALHDIGKIGVPDSILFKPGKLTPEEMEIMKKHTMYGRDALLKSEHKVGHNDFLHQAALIAYTHQERWNGSGYPQGLRGEEIPLSGRIMAVADVYDALTTKRVYKEPMPHDEAIAYIEQNSGVLFDPDIIGLFPRLKDKFYQIYKHHKDETNLT